MKEAILLLMHLLNRVAMLFGTSGSRSLLAENMLLKQQLMVLRDQQRRSPPCFGFALPPGTARERTFVADVSRSRQGEAF
jgi:hypothetical protein